MNLFTIRHIRRPVGLALMLAMLLTLPALATQPTPTPTWPPAAEQPQTEWTEAEAALIAGARTLLVDELDIDGAYLPQGTLTVEMMTLWGPEREVALAIFDDQPGGVLYAVYLDPVDGTPLQAEAFRMEDGVCITELLYQQEGLVAVPEGLEGIEGRK